MRYFFSFFPFVRGRLTHTFCCSSTCRHFEQQMHSYLVFHLKFHNCQFLSAFVFGTGWQFFCPCCWSASHSHGCGWCLAPAQVVCWLPVPLVFFAQLFHIAIPHFKCFLFHNFFFVSFVGCCCRLVCHRLFR